MKTIGLIGGMSWESSKVYYKLLNTRVKALLGGVHSCDCILVSVDFAGIEHLTFQDKWDEIGDMMADCARKLEKAGAEMIILCTNTIHLVSEAIVNSVSIPFIHIAEATGMVIARQKLQKVLLLGTRFTMEKDFYTRLLQETFALQVMIPAPADREILQHIIYQELVRGEFTNEARNHCKRMILKSQSEGAEGVILGCTEMPILLEDIELDIPAFDTTALHVQMAVRLALEPT